MIIAVFLAPPTRLQRYNMFSQFSPNNDLPYSWPSLESTCVTLSESQNDPECVTSSESPRMPLLVQLIIIVTQLLQDLQRQIIVCSSCNSTVNNYITLQHVIAHVPLSRACNPSEALPWVVFLGSVIVIALTRIVQIPSRQSASGPQGPTWSSPSSEKLRRPASTPHPSKSHMPVACDSFPELLSTYLRFSQHQVWPVHPWHYRYAVFMWSLKIQVLGSTKSYTGDRQMDSALSQSTAESGNRDCIVVQKHERTITSAALLRRSPAIR